MRKLVDGMKEFLVYGISFVSFFIFLGEIFNWLLYV